MRKFSCSAEKDPLHPSELVAIALTQEPASNPNESHPDCRRYLRDISTRRQKNRAPLVTVEGLSDAKQATLFGTLAVTYLKTNTESVSE